MFIQNFKPKDLLKKQISFVLKGLFFGDFPKKNKIKVDEIINLLQTNNKLIKVEMDQENLVIEVLLEQFNAVLENGYICGILLKNELIPQYDRMFLSSRSKLDYSYLLETHYNPTKPYTETQIEFLQILSAHFFFQKDSKISQYEIFNILDEQRNVQLLPSSLCDLTTRNLQNLFAPTIKSIEGKITRLSETKKQKTIRPTGYINLISKDNYLKNLMSELYIKKS